MITRYRFCIFLLILFIGNHSAFAHTIYVAPSTIIDKDTTFKNIGINLTRGSFVVTKGATLSILNCNIIGTVSAENNFFISITSGHLIFKNNKVTVKANLNADPVNPPLYYMIKLQQGGVDIVSNYFSVNRSYALGLFTTNHLATSGLNFKRNTIYNFHGGILLTNSRSSQINENRFFNVSSSNIFILNSRDITINSNNFLFPGNNNIGDGIDISDSQDITISNNDIVSGSCYSLVVSDCKDILLIDNRIIAGITYAIYLTSSVLEKDAPPIFYEHDHRATHFIGNSNIQIIHNYLSQNRFGLGVLHVDGLVAKNNIFIQRFKDQTSRKFWTNNDNVIKNTLNMIWEDNVYKEAYNQNSGGDEMRARKFVTFPAHGGITF